jgi:hypothetical protein
MHMFHSTIIERLGRLRRDLRKPGSLKKPLRSGPRFQVEARRDRERVYQNVKNSFWVWMVRPQKMMKGKKS